MEIKLLNGQNFSKLKARTMILMILEGFHQQEVFCEYIVNDVFERTFLLWFNWTFRKRPDLFASLPEVGVWRWGRNGSVCTHIMVSLVGSIPVTRLLKNDSFANIRFFCQAVCLHCTFDVPRTDAQLRQLSASNAPCNANFIHSELGHCWSFGEDHFLLQWPVCFLILAIQVGV